MKTKTYPIFHIDGRRARTLRKALGMPRDLKDLDEDATAEKTQIELALVAETLNLPRLKYDHLAGPDAFLCGGALTAWLGGYPPSDYDFFVPTLELAERLHHRLLYQGAVLDGYQGTEAGQPIYDAIQKGELHIDELVIENEEIRALNYSMPTNARASRCYRPARSGLQPRPSISNCPPQSSRSLASFRSAAGSATAWHPTSLTHPTASASCPPSPKTETHPVLRQT